VRYANLQTAIWQHRGIKSLTRPQRELYIYLLTSPHGNTAGIYSLSLAYLMDDMGMDAAEAQDALDGLCATGRVMYDSVSAVVLIRDHLEHNPPHGIKQAAGVAAAVKSLPGNGLSGEWVKWATHHAPQYSELWQTVPRGSVVIAPTPTAPDPPPAEPDERQTLFDWLQRHMPHVISKTNVDLAETMAEETHWGVVLRAAEVAVGENKRTWSYLQGVWRRYRDDRCRTYADALASDEQRLNAPARASPKGAKGLAGLAAELERVRGERMRDES
jgi:hypothetical protein